MSWTCPYEVKGFCQRRHKTCEPLAKNCVLEGKGLVLANTEIPSGDQKKSVRKRK